jgi:hypothetical protein
MVINNHSIVVANFRVDTRTFPCVDRGYLETDALRTRDERTALVDG